MNFVKSCTMQSLRLQGYKFKYTSGVFLVTPELQVSKFDSHEIILYFQPSNKRDLMYLPVKRIKCGHIIWQLFEQSIPAARVKLIMLLVSYPLDQNYYRS